MNGDFTPDKVTPGSQKKALWRCEKCGKVWQQTIKTKVKGPLNCPECKRKRAGELRIQTMKRKKKLQVVDGEEHGIIR